MTEALVPIRRRVVVTADPERAFRLFTDEIGAWWPLELRLHGNERADDGREEIHSSVAFEGGELVETAASGARAVWGKVIDWSPGLSFRISWHPGLDAALATEVAVLFEAIDGTPERTLVTLEHDGWERTPEPDAMRAEYESGWPGVLAAFSTLADDHGTEVWIVLRHTPGPNAPPDGPLMAHPDFAEHLAFLQRLRASGILVGAGPLPSESDGRVGMALLRVPESVADDYEKQARFEDQSVTRGLLTVEPIRWQVLLSS